MPKSNRRRKQDRAKAIAKRAQQQRRRERRAEAKAVEENYERIRDPKTPPEELARLIAVQYEEMPVSGWLVSDLLERGRTEEELTATAAVLRRTRSLTAVTFEAAVAHVTGDVDSERRLIDRAVELSSDLDTRLAVIHFILVLGDVAHAIDLLSAVLREDPEDEWANEQYGVAIDRLAREGGDTTAFTDRSALTALRDAIGAYLERSPYGSAVESAVAGELAETDDLDWSEEETAAFGALAEEVALLTAGPGEEDDDGPLQAFAADPSTSPVLASRADAWVKHAHYGLWKFDNEPRSPGVWVTDLVTVTRRYTEFPEAITSSLPRWSVWLGALVPVDGVWHATGTGLLLTPGEADAVADFIDRAMARMVGELADIPEDELPPLAPVSFGDAEPNGVIADEYDPVSPEMARLASKMTAALLTTIAVDVVRHRTIPPSMRNTDGDPMLLITAAIKVARDVTARLLARRDFTQDDDAITWWGIEIPAGQQKALMAEAMARLRGEDLDPEPPSSDGPQRWIRGWLRPGDGVITADVNSRKRLERLLGILARLGAEPVIVDEKRIDPAQDLPWTGGPVVTPGGSAPAAEGWEGAWLDQNIPALLGRTPRQAARSKEEVKFRLEAMLRAFEHDADLLAVQGKSGIDVGWLRQQLNMPEAWAD